MKKDIVIIGGGPAGYAAAIRAAQNGFDTVIIENDSLGGTCLNRGCIPTKVHYRNAQLINDIKNSDEFGISIDNYQIDFDKFAMRKEQVVNKLVSGVQHLLKANKVDIIKGIGSITSINTVEVTLSDGEISIIEADKIMIATGSLPALPPISGTDLDDVVTSEELLNITNPPKSITIIGGGVIGIEFAGILNSYGTEVTIVEYMPKLLPQMDTDISKRIASYLKRQGIKILTNTMVESITKDGDLIVKGSSKGKEIQLNSQMVLVSTGRRPNYTGLNLDKLGVDYDKKGIKVNDNYQTNIPNIYAVGDVIGGQMLAHVASEEAIAAIDTMCGNHTKLNYNAVPSCVFSFPQIAVVGMTEDVLKEKEIDYKKSKFMFGANGKALAMNDAEGFIKVLADTGTNKILGVHIMGPHASDLIHESALAIQNKLDTKAIEHTIHAHPTLSEAFHEAVMGINDNAIHITPSLTKLT